MIKACIFDLDGTLLDTVKSLQYFLNRALSKNAIPQITEEQTKFFVGEGALTLTRRAMNAGGVDTESLEGKMESIRICEEFMKDYNSDPYYLTSPYEGISDAVKALADSGMKLAVISNKPDFTTKTLIEKNFGGIFEIVEGAKATVPLKPDPTAPLDICARLGVLPEETAYFGDTATDMKTAKNYGAGVIVGVSWGFRDRDELISNGADKVIDHPSEIVGCAL